MTPLSTPSLAKGAGEARVRHPSWVRSGSNPNARGHRATRSRPAATRDGGQPLPSGGGGSPCAATEHSGAKGYAPQSAPILVIVREKAPALPPEIP